MGQHNRNGKEMEKLAEEIRKLGIPYASPEPEPQYWVNFRVRVLDRIESHESKVREGWSIGALFLKSKEWVAEHLLGVSLTGAAATIAIAVLLNPFEQSKMEQSQTSKPLAQNVRPTQPAPTPDAVPVTPDGSQASSAMPRQSPAIQKSDRWMASHLSVKHVKELDNMALADEQAAQPALMNSEPDYAVSLIELSSPELKSVLKSMKDVK